MRSHTHEEVEDEWDQEEVPLEATLSSPHPKPPISKFKASRIASSYNTSPPLTSPGQSLGQSVLPASSFRTLERTVRMGKFENDQLVSSTQSDTEDEDAGMKDVLEMLKKGEVQNIGPEPLSRPTSGPPIPSSEVRVLSTAAKPKTSKFKLAQPQRRPSPSSPGTSESQPVTPTSHARRSSPKLPASPIGVADCQPSSSSSIPPREPQLVPQLSAIVSLPSSQIPMIIDSPSFRRPPHMASKSPAASSSFLTTVDSPSFRNPTIVASPVIQQEPSRGSTRPDRPPLVMSSTVREATHQETGNRERDLPEACNSTSGGGKKVSRFLAERM